MLLPRAYKVASVSINSDEFTVRVLETNNQYNILNVLFFVTWTLESLNFLSAVSSEILVPDHDA